jgi:hypothetical protein
MEAFFEELRRPHANLHRAKRMFGPSPNESNDAGKPIAATFAPGFPAALGTLTCYADWGRRNLARPKAGPLVGKSNIERGAHADAGHPIIGLANLLWFQN